jgi:hypothetical protein
LPDFGNNEIIDGIQTGAAMPILPVLYELEACADQRIDNDVCALSKLTKIADLARDLMQALTGSTANPRYPERRRG